MSTDEIIQLFRLIDLAKLRKWLDDNATTQEKVALVKFLKLVQRKL